jgi:quercetin dioxygenase-like cupin family protein
MGNYDDILIWGDERERELALIREQMQEWELTMPDVEPLPLHFGLGKFRDIGETEFWIANDQEHNYCGKFLFLFDGQTCPEHKHAVKHETFFVLKGSIRMIVNGQEQILKQGDILVMPPGELHKFTGIGPALVLEVSMPSILNDNFFTIKDIGNNGVV